MRERPSRPGREERGGTWASPGRGEETGLRFENRGHFIPNEERRTENRERKSPFDFNRPHFILRSRFSVPHLAIAFGLKSPLGGASLPTPARGPAAGRVRRLRGGRCRRDRAFRQR